MQKSRGRMRMPAHGVKAPLEPYPTRALEHFRPLVTAAEAYPQLEARAWEAERAIWLAFRIFDPTTRLRGNARTGETWLDLLRAKLRQGVDVRVMLADFDPIGAEELHEATWRSVHALRELSDEGPLEILPVRHEARVGKGLRVGFWLPAFAEIERQRTNMNAMPSAARRIAFAARPGLWRYLRLSRSGEIRWRLPRMPRLFPATHHQKIAVFDGTCAVIGGLDVDERRYDDPDHDRPAAETWHDVSVEVSGALAADVARHVGEVWNANRLGMAALRREQTRRAPHGTGPMPAAASRIELPVADATPAPEEGGGRLIRTISENRRRRLLRLSPRTVCREIEESHLELISSAQTLIYAETQFLRSLTIASALAEAGRSRPELGLIMVLPAAPEDIAFEEKTGIAHRMGEHLQSACIAEVEEAFGPRAAILSPVRPVSSDSDGRDRSHGAEIVYVHSKVMIADDERAIVSSANLNGRSMLWDTEAGILCTSPGHVANLREALWRHWLPDEADAELFGLEGAAAAWRRLAHRNAALPPEKRAGFLVPHETANAEAFGYPVPVLPDALV